MGQPGFDPTLKRQGMGHRLCNPFRTTRFFDPNPFDPNPHGSNPNPIDPTRLPGLLPAHTFFPYVLLSLLCCLFYLFLCLQWPLALLLVIVIFQFKLLKLNGQLHKAHVRCSFLMYNFVQPPPAFVAKWVLFPLRGGRSSFSTNGRGRLPTIV
jgi:hypothetical protein